MHIGHALFIGDAELINVLTNIGALFGLCSVYRLIWLLILVPVSASPMQLSFATTGLPGLEAAHTLSVALAPAL